MNVEGISANQIIEAIERGSKFQQTDGILSVYSYFSVAYKQLGAKYLIKTVFVNRRENEMLYMRKIGID